MAAPRPSPPNSRPGGGIPVTTTTNQLILAVPTALLLGILEPFDCPPWPVTDTDTGFMPPFTADDVRAVVATDRLYSRRILFTDFVDAATHISRVACLVQTWTNDGSDPPIVEVMDPEWLIVDDGYHRICAAAVRGDEHVHVEVGGWLEAAEQMFGVRIP